jgi:signal transduction histidine kinase
MIAIQHPEGIPRFKWLLNGSNIRFKGAFFYWIFQDRLSRLILGGSGFSLLILGLLYRLKSEHLFFFSWIFGMILYVIIFATGNITHDYYQVPLIPILAIFVAKGIYYLFTKHGTIVERIFYILLTVFLVGLMTGLRWREVRTLFNINNPKIVEVGKLADQILPQDAKVIAPYGGDTAFLYQTNRKGWPAVYLPLGEMIKNGATHYVTVSLDSQAKDLVKDYRTIIATSQYAIIDLTQKNSKVINDTQ